MNELLLILYFLGMVLVPVLRLRLDPNDRRRFLLLYLLAAFVVTFFSPYPVLSSLAIVYLPIFIASLIGDISYGAWFKVLYLLVNVLVLLLLTNLQLYSKPSLSFILILLTMFVLLIKEKRKRYRF